MYYQITDKHLKTLKKKMLHLFGRTKSTLGFDELNILSKIKTLYKDLEELNETEFLEIANEVYKSINPRGNRKLDLVWLLVLLQGYNEVTKYVYLNEVDRKCARLYESVMSSKRKAKELITARNLWWSQTSQFADNVTEYAVITAYIDMGIKKVKWNTQKDDKVCKSCEERDGKIYSINNLPVKHYHCRCYYTPIIESGGKDG